MRIQTEIEEAQKIGRIIQRPLSQENRTGSKQRAKPSSKNPEGQGAEAAASREQIHENNMK